MPGVNTFVQHFGSWGAALEAAGIKNPSKARKPQKAHRKKYSDDELIAALLEAQTRCAKEGKRLIYIEMKTGKPSALTIASRFGGWTKALKAAGIK